MKSPEPQKNGLEKVAVRMCVVVVVVYGPEASVKAEMDRFCKNVHKTYILGRIRICTKCCFEHFFNQPHFSRNSQLFFRHVGNYVPVSGIALFVLVA